MGRNFVFGGVLVFFFLFSTQNQVPQKTSEMGRVIYHNEALSIVIRMTFKKIQFFFHSSEKNRFEVLDFWSISELMWYERIYNSLQ